MGARRRARGDHHPTPAPRPTSGQPPPHTTRESRTAAASTHRASCRDRSASSSKWLDAPRSTMVAAAPRAQPLKWTRRSSPTMISETESAVPRTAVDGSSNVDAMSAPVT